MRRPLPGGVLAALIDLRSTPGFGEGTFDAPRTKGTFLAEHAANKTMEIAIDTTRGRLQPRISGTVPDITTRCALTPAFRYVSRRNSRGKPSL